MKQGWRGVVGEWKLAGMEEYGPVSHYRFHHNSSADLICKLNTTILPPSQWWVVARGEAEPVCSLGPWSGKYFHRFSSTSYLRHCLNGDTACCPGKTHLSPSCFLSH
jgi:hypothetical protein